MAHSAAPDDQLMCSFCGKSQLQIRQLIAGPGVYICNECVELCNGILDEDRASASLETGGRLPKPQEIYGVLNRYVIGQEHAKRTLSVAVYNHYKRVQSDADDIELQKSNVLLLGPSGCGKTLLAQTLARLLHVPFTIADATTLTEAGYVGEDVESILLALISAADYDVEQAQTGIVYIDEIDKLARREESGSLGREVSGEGVQQALLTMIEGSTTSIRSPSTRSQPQYELPSIDTTNVLFICGGTFDGLDRMIGRRVGHQAVGFGAAVRSWRQRDAGDLLEQCQPADLVRYGLIPELVSRLPVITAIHQLSREEMTRVLTEPRNALVRQFQQLFSCDRIDLVFTDEALGSIADGALERGTGARGLRSILEETLLDAQFELPSRPDICRCIVTRETVERGAAPTLEPARTAQQVA